MISTSPPALLPDTDVPGWPDHDIDTAADVLWLAMDVRNYDWLVRQRAWAVDTVAAAILGVAQKDAPQMEAQGHLYGSVPSPAA